jgi:hypothetical protein
MRGLLGKFARILFSCSVLITRMVQIYRLT